VRLLLLTHRLPYPPDKGDRIRSYHWLSALAGEHDVDLLTLTDREPQANHLQALKKHARNVWAVTRSKPAAFCELPKSFPSRRSLTEAWFWSRRFARKLDQLLADNSYDACLAVCSNIAGYLLNAADPPRLIVDLVDADSTKWRLYAHHHSGLRRWLFARESRKIALLEQRLLLRADTVITVSSNECRHFNHIPRRAELLAIPNGVDTDYFAPSTDHHTSDRLVIVGQMDYFPNVDAVCWVAENDWPDLSMRFPELTWTVVGRHPTRQIRQLAGLPNITVTGEVGDVRGYLTNAIAVAPLRIACGVQNKVLEAMAAACPVVASWPAVRGLDIRPQHELLVADRPDEYLAAIKLLLADKALARRIGQNARQAMIDRYRWSDTEPQMCSAVAAGQSERLKTNLPVYQSQ